VDPAALGLGRSAEGHPGAGAGDRGGLTSRRKAVEATGYDIEEIDRENAADAARAPGSASLPHQPRRDAGRAGDAHASRGSRTPNNRSESMRSWYAIRARAGGAEVAIYDEIGAYGVSAKGFLAELGALPDGTRSTCG
jgi:hypothetical protein